MLIRDVPLVAIIILTLLTPVIRSSASYAHIDDDQLWRESDTIIIGTVTSITSEESGNRVYYYVEVQVERYLKNPSETSSIVIHYYTRINRVIVTPDGTATTYEDISDIDLDFKVGEKVYVFLKQVIPEYYEVYGWFQGKYSIVDGVAISPIGRTISIPTPVSPIVTIVMIGSGLGVAVLFIMWYKRNLLFERIVGI